MRSNASHAARASRWAVMTALALIAACVAVGIFGPRIGDGRGDDALLPMGDLAVTARDVQQRMQLEALERPEEAPGPTSSELAMLALESLGAEWTPPDLASVGGVAVLAGPVPLSLDGHGLAILYEFEELGEARFIALLALPDSGRHAVFDEFGRARVLYPTQAILEPDSPEDADGPSTLAWSDGTMIFVARCDERLGLALARVALGAP